MMIAMPITVTAAPTRSQRSGRTPLMAHSQNTAIATYTQPYAAYTRPDAVEWRVRSQANTDRLTAAGSNNHGDPPFRSHRYGR